MKTQSRVTSPVGMSHHVAVGHMPEIFIIFEGALLVLEVTTYGQTLAAPQATKQAW